MTQFRNVSTRDNDDLLPTVVYRVNGVLRISTSDVSSSATRDSGRVTSSESELRPGSLNGVGRRKVLPHGDGTVLTEVPRQVGRLERDTVPRPKS